MAKFYGIRGRAGYLHAACLPVFEQAHSTYDVQGRPAYRPSIDACLDTLGPAYREVCIHCGKPLRAASPFTPAGIVAGLSRSMKAAYRKLKGNARKRGSILVYEHAGNALALILAVEADDPVLLRGRTVLFDPRQENALA